MSKVICASLVLFDSTLRYVATGVSAETGVHKFFGGGSEPEDVRDTEIGTAVACAQREMFQECGISAESYTVDDEPVYVKELTDGSKQVIGHQYFFFAATRGALILPLGDFDGEMVEREMMYAPRFISAYLSSVGSSRPFGFHHTIALVRALAHIKRHYGNDPLLREFRLMLKNVRPQMELDALEAYLWSYKRRTKEQTMAKV